MAARRTVDVYIDLRSPYSYLAIGPARDLQERTGIQLDWWPFVTDFQSAYGGEVHERSARDVAKLKYLYMDCRRLAERQGLEIRATTKLWDPTLGSQAMLFAKACDKLWEFLIPMLASFWKRDFDLESAEQTGHALANAGCEIDAWEEFRGTRAQSDLHDVVARAQSLGVFGAPSFVLDGELFWGGDRLALLAERLDARTVST